MRRTVAAAAALAMLAAACGGADPDPSATTDAPDVGADEVTDDAPEDEPDEVPEDEPDPGTTPEPEAPDPATDDEPEDTDPDGTDTPEPDPAAVADPCAEHEGRDGEGFIDVVAPVDGQVVGDEVELVGCSNVFEATVSYRIEDEDGTVFDDGFTTAECGSGCVGAFSETIDLTPAGDLRAVYLHVWSANMDDEGEPELFPTARVVVRDGR